ncbi:hypothetical protein [Rhizobium sp. LC145]|uniref:hypothetical protein n=1 Tax=Rhizobium sp. LC145 TaxID=1120688 RepID=UPI000A4DFB41|nr:hypothetical protein [Rhizobium sp. LC145]MDX3927932.1 hypothetical protein [Shinella sp.]TKT69013.1 hypothetical protein FDR95_01175 [Rhizobiaceae bacterium LC148]
MTIVFRRSAANGVVAIAGRRGGASPTTGGRRDKKPHIAARSVGCFDWLFRNVTHITALEREERVCELSNDFRENRTSQRKTP